MGFTTELLRVATEIKFLIIMDVWHSNKHKWNNDFLNQAAIFIVFTTQEEIHLLDGPD